jgi:hypothetical protein
VFKALTTFASGKARWICSPSESVLATSSVGGSLREVERVGDVEEHLPVQVLRPCRFEHRDRPRALGRVHDELGFGCCFLRRRQLDPGMRILPTAEGRLPR